MPDRNGSSRVDVALLVLRVVAGVVFVAHGAQKLFVFGFAGTAGAFTQMGVPMAEVVGPMIGLLEFFGGIALVAGLLARLAALGLACDMLGATLIVHLPNGFFNPGGIEFTMTLCAVAVSLAVAGAGRFSLDHLIATRRAAS